MPRLASVTIGDKRTINTSNYNNYSPSAMATIEFAEGDTKEEVQEFIAKTRAMLVKLNTTAGLAHLQSIDDGTDVLFNRMFERDQRSAPVGYLPAEHQQKG